MSNQTQIIEFNVPHDGGNGYMKDRINGQTTIFPSVLSRFLPGMQSTVVNSKDHDAVQRLLKNYLDDMDITVQSNGINVNARYLVGKAAISSGATVTTFNVSSVEGKATSDISIICLLSLISYKAIKAYYDLNLELPTQLEVNIPKMATDLPIDETKNKSIRESYIARFNTNKHIIVVNNFENPITVTITFQNVTLQPEGVIGANGLILSHTTPHTFRDDEVFQPLVEDYHLDHFDGQDLLECGNVIGIDIGDGTVDFSATNGLQALPNMNDSLNLGVGNISEDAISALHQAYPSIRKLNRQKFMEIAERGDDAESKTYRQFLNDQAITLNQQIISKVSSMYSRLDQQVGMIVVSGGGAVTLKDSLYLLLQETMKQLDSFNKTKIFWVGKEYAQTLNLDGLEARILAMKD